jgi:hypothetical protein
MRMAFPVRPGSFLGRHATLAIKPGRCLLVNGRAPGLPEPSADDERGVERPGIPAGDDDSPAPWGGACTDVPRPRDAAVDTALRIQPARMRRTGLVVDGDLASSIRRHRRRKRRNAARIRVVDVKKLDLRRCSCRDCERRDCGRDCDQFLQGLPAFRSGVSLKDQAGWAGARWDGRDLVTESPPPNGSSRRHRTTVRITEVLAQQRDGPLPWLSCPHVQA